MATYNPYHIAGEKRGSERSTGWYSLCNTRELRGNDVSNICVEKNTGIRGPHTNRMVSPVAGILTSGSRTEASQ